MYMLGPSAFMRGWVPRAMPVCRWSTEVIAQAVRAVGGNRIRGVKCVI